MEEIRQGIEKDDAISREAAIDAIQHAKIDFKIISKYDLSKLKKEFREFTDEVLKAQEKALNAVPKIKPKREESCWVQMNDEGACWWECMKCDFVVTEDQALSFNYCPNCGVKM